VHSEKFNAKNDSIVQKMIKNAIDFLQ